MLSGKVFAEVLQAFEKSLHLIDTLREAGDSIKWLSLSIHVVKQIVDGLYDILEDRQSFIVFLLLSSIVLDHELSLNIQPALIRRSYASIDEKLQRWRDTVPKPVKKAEFAQVVESVDKVLHLVHHDLCVVVVTVQAQYSQLLRLP